MNKSRQDKICIFIYYTVLTFYLLWLFDFCLLGDFEYMGEILDKLFGEFYGNLLLLIFSVGLFVFSHIILSITESIFYPKTKEELEQSNKKKKLRTEYNKGNITKKEYYKRKKQLKIERLEDKIKLLRSNK